MHDPYPPTRRYTHMPLPIAYTYAPCFPPTDWHNLHPHRRIHDSSDPTVTIALMCIRVVEHHYERFRCEKTKVHPSLLLVSCSSCSYLMYVSLQAHPFIKSLRPTTAPPPFTLSANPLYLHLRPSLDQAPSLSSLLVPPTSTLYHFSSQILHQYTITHISSSPTSSAYVTRLLNRGVYLRVDGC